MRVLHAAAGAPLSPIAQMPRVPQLFMLMRYDADAAARMLRSATWFSFAASALPYAAADAAATLSPCRHMRARARSDASACLTPSF